MRALLYGFSMCCWQARCRTVLIYEVFITETNRVGFHGAVKGTVVPLNV